MASALEVVKRFPVDDRSSSVTGEQDVAVKKLEDVRAPLESYSDLRLSVTSLKKATYMFWITLLRSSIQSTPEDTFVRGRTSEVYAQARVVDIYVRP